MTAADMDKVNSTIRQFVSDWSKEGEGERNQTYGPILKMLDKMYKNTAIQQRHGISVLVPGAGLGRLAYEIAQMGFTCQGIYYYDSRYFNIFNFLGNEYSFFMLLASDFILNNCPRVEEFTIYPWIHNYNNILQPKDQLKAVRLPVFDFSPFLNHYKGYSLPASTER